MNTNSRNSAIAAAVFLLVFGFGAFYLPNIMLAVGSMSPAAAGVLAVFFVVAFFGVFWLRARSQRNKGN